MQPGEEIESLVDELEQIVNEAKSPIMDNGQKKIVDAQDVYEILDEIRRIFPQEFSDARRILKEEQEMLDRAQQQANSIIADAQQQAMILAGDQEVVRLAQQQADGIRDQAAQYERDTRYNAEEYADTVLAHLEENLKSLTSSVSRVRQTLDENSGPRNTTNNTCPGSRRHGAFALCHRRPPLRGGGHPASGGAP